MRVKIYEFVCGSDKNASTKETKKTIIEGRNDDTVKGTRINIK